MNDAHHPGIGDLAPQFTLPDLTGELVSLTDVLREHMVVVHFVREFT